MKHNLKQSILLVDADSANQDSIRTALRDLDLEVVIADATNDVAQLVSHYDFALILLAVSPASLSPFETAMVLGNNERTRYIPVIFLAESEYVKTLFEQGYAAGCVDFLHKPILPKVLLAKVKVFLELDARQRQLEFATATIQEQNLKLEERAIRDSLTGLYNHNYLLDQLAREISLARRYGSPLSVFMLDLDFFKDVNDTCGHPFGDFVLNTFAGRVQKNLRESDIFGRYGGEEFLIILPNIDEEQAGMVAEKIRKKVGGTVFSNSRYRRYVTVSIGVYSGHGAEIDSVGRVIDFVDNALYQAKAEGRNRVCHHSAPVVGQYAGADEHISNMIGTTQQSQLTATVDKCRAMTLASFEAMVHSQTREYEVLADRNVFFTKVLDCLAKQLNIPEQLVHTFRRAIKLHDLFRCYINDSSLEIDGPLTKEQEEMLLDQPVMLLELTSMFDFFASERVILHAHHEFFDGTGYPDGLRGNEIPMAARIFTLVDSFVAMVAPVTKKNGKSRAEVKKELQKFSGVQFDPFLVDILMRIIETEDLFDSEREEK